MSRAAFLKTYLLKFEILNLIFELVWNIFNVYTKNDNSFNQEYILTSLNECDSLKVSPFLA